MMRVTTGWLVRKRVEPDQDWIAVDRNGTRKQAEISMWLLCSEGEMGAEYKIVRLYRRVRGVK